MPSPTKRPVSNTSFQSKIHRRSRSNQSLNSLGMDIKVISAEEYKQKMLNRVSQMEQEE